MGTHATAARTGRLDPMVALSRSRPAERAVEELDQLLGANHPPPPTCRALRLRTPA